MWQTIWPKDTQRAARLLRDSFIYGDTTVSAPWRHHTARPTSPHRRRPPPPPIFDALVRCATTSLALRGTTPSSVCTAYAVFLSRQLAWAEGGAIIRNTRNSIHCLDVSELILNLCRAPIGRGLSDERGRVKAGGAAVSALLSGRPSAPTGTDNPFYTGQQPPVDTRAARARKAVEVLCFP